MTDSDYKKLKDYLEEELQFDPTNPQSLRDKQSKIPQLLQQFLTIYANEKEHLIWLQSRLKITHSEFFHKYKYNRDKKGNPIVNFDFDYNLNTKGDIEVYVQGDDNYAKKALAVKKQELQVEFLDRSIQNIKDMSWALKASFEQLKYFEGG